MESDLTPKFAPFFGMVRLSHTSQRHRAQANTVQGGIAFAVSSISIAPAY